MNTRRTRLAVRLCNFILNWLAHPDYRQFLDNAVTREMIRSGLR